VTQCDLSTITRIFSVTSRDFFLRFRHPATSEEKRVLNEKENKNSRTVGEWFAILKP